MRIITRLRLIKTGTVIALVVLVPVLIVSFLDFTDAKNDYALADQIKAKYFERATLMDQYFLHREVSVVTLWDQSKAGADMLLQRAGGLVHNEEDQRNLDVLSRSINDAEAIFHRLVSNTNALNTAGNSRAVYEDLDKILYSQLLLKSAAVRNTASALKDASAQRIEQAYRRLVIIVSVFAAVLAFTTIMSSIQLSAFIRKRLQRLHDGAKYIADGNLDFRIKSKGSDEFSELAASVNMMTDKLQRELEKNRALLRNASDGIHILDVDANIIEASDSFCEMLGYTRDEVIGMNLTRWDANFVGPELMRKFREQFEKRERSEFETRHRRKDGSIFDVEVSGFPLELEGKTVVFNSSRDITARKRAEQALRESENRFHVMADNAPVMIWVSDENKLCNWFNKIWLDFTGRTMAQEIGNGWADGVHPEDLQRCLDIYTTSFDARQEFTMEYRLRRSDGEYRWLIDHGVPRFDDQGRFLGYIGSCVDISDRHLMEEQVRQLAFYDMLTGLPNRRLLNDRLARIMAASKRNSRHAALMFIDLDNFKQLNDIHGHDVGDLLLAEAAGRIGRCVRAMDTVARIGGDEFIVVLSELEEARAGSVRQAHLVAEKIRNALSEPYALTARPEGSAGGTTIIHRCTSSIGVAVFLGYEGSQEELIKRADAAMYRAKEGGRNQIRSDEAA